MARGSLEPGGTEPGSLTGLDQKTRRLRCARLRRGVSHCAEIIRDAGCGEMDVMDAAAEHRLAVALIICLSFMLHFKQTSTSLKIL